MFYRFLTESQERVLQAERQALLTLRGPLAALDASASDMALLDRAILQLDELFLLVVVGEFNAGKSALINALLGQRVLIEGVTPTTTQITLVKYGELRAGDDLSPREIAIVTCPVEWLRDVNIVDTPGTNAIIRQHQQLTEDFVPRADLILFVTSADRPFSESERAFLQRIREWGKKVILIINKIDILQSEADVERIVSFVQAHGRELLGRSPVIFPVSARLAQLAKDTIDADERTRCWTASRFEALEDHILHTLDERQRLRLKLANPLGVARRLAARYLAAAAERQALLHEDIATMRGIEARLATYQEQMRGDFKYRLSHVDNVLYAMAERGRRFFDETIRLARIFDLVNADRIQGLFQRAVVADSAAEIEAHTQELIDWLVDQDYRQWQEITDYVGQRLARHPREKIGRLSGKPGFEASRRALLESAGRVARETVATYDRESEARNLAESLQMAVAQTAIVEAGAIGLGALLVKVLAVTLADVTGLLAAGAVAAFGLYLIPAKRRRAQNELQAKIADLRGRLNQALTAQFEHELSRSVQRIREAIEPYTRFVEAQQAAVAAAENALQETLRRLDALEEEIGRL